MNDYPKHNPGCYHSMVHYLAKCDGVDEYKYTVIRTLEEFWDGGYSPKNAYIAIGEESYPMWYKRHAKGGIQSVQTQDKIFTSSDQFDYIFIKTLKHVSEFKTKYQRCGKYNDSLGGGWYCKVPMYNVGDKYFADMECACR